MFEKEAEEFADSKDSFWRQGRTCIASVIQAFQKGAEFGYKKGLDAKINITRISDAPFLWHKVADGDLPKDENDVLVYSGEDWRMCVGRYSPKYKTWEAGCDTIAWCEIPQFKEE